MKKNSKVTEKTNNNRAKKLIVIFFTMMKIGLFTFGGGYAMISLLHNEFVLKKKWLTEEEFLDMTAIAESTPGPIAINASTYIGYSSGGILGSLLGTLGVCIPSFVIILIISLFFDAFLSITLVSYAFKGIRACVIFLIGSAGIRMLRSIGKKPLPIILFSATVICMTVFYILSISFSSVFYILIGGLISLGIYSFSFFSERKTKKSDDGEEKR